MSKKRAHKNRRVTSPAHPSSRSSQAIQDEAETRTAVAATVAWMLSLMSTITAEALGLLCRWYTILVEPIDLLTVLSTVMLFVALISGVVTVGLIPVVLRVARTPPPRPIVQVALVAGCLPIVAITLQFLFHAR